MILLHCYVVIYIVIVIVTVLSQWSK